MNSLVVVSGKFWNFDDIKGKSVIVATALLKEQSQGYFF